MFKVSQAVLMSRQELRTSDPKMKLQCLIMEGSSSTTEPFADLSLSLSPQCIHQTMNSALPRVCQGHSFRLHPHPQGPFPPPSFFLPLPHPCFAGLVYIAASPPWGLYTLPHPGRDQNLILEKWATWEQYTSVLFPTRGWLRNLQNPLQNGNAEPLVQKLLRISRWHQLSVKA